MAVENAECFDIYGTDTSLMLENGYAAVSSGFGTLSLVADPDGTSTQRCLFFAANSGLTGIGIRYVLQTAAQKVGVAMRLWMNTLPENTGQRPPIIIWADSGNTEIAHCQVETTGRISIVKADGTVLGTTTAPVITPLGWWHIEAFIDATAGTAGLRVEGVTKLTITAAGFASGTVYQVSHRTDGDTISAHPAQYMKDIVWWNGLGTQNNSYLGAVRCLNLPPVSDNTLGGWSPSTGTEAWPILDNNPPNDAIYLAGALSDVNVPMIVEMANLPADVSSVKALITYVRAEKIDGGDGNLQNSVVSSGTAGAGADNPITAAPLYWRDVFELDPHTAAAWTPGAVDLAQLKINRTV